jgi:uncharacterized membrane protein YuzA (DUF378 family)
MFSQGATQAHDIYAVAGLAAVLAMVLTFSFPILERKIAAAFEQACQKRQNNRPMAKPRCP